MPLPAPIDVLRRLEPWLLKPLKYAPFDLQRLALEQMLREAYPEPLRDGAFEPLRGRWLRIDVIDGPGWNVTLGRSAPIVVAGPVDWDVRVAARLEDYVLLANQQADPDTLFFQRRLVIEGDTELGLVVKNLIFGNELAGVPAFIARALGEFRTAVANAGSGRRVQHPGDAEPVAVAGVGIGQRQRVLTDGERIAAGAGHQAR